LSVDYHTLDRKARRLRWCARAIKWSCNATKQRVAPGSLAGVLGIACNCGVEATASGRIASICGALVLVVTVLGRIHASYKGVTRGAVALISCRQLRAVDSESALASSAGVSGALVSIITHFDINLLVATPASGHSVVGSANSLFAQGIRARWANTLSVYAAGQAGSQRARVNGARVAIIAKLSCITQADRSAGTVDPANRSARIVAGRAHTASSDWLVEASTIRGAVIGSASVVVITQLLCV